MCATIIIYSSSPGAFFGTDRTLLVVNVRKKENDARWKSRSKQRKKQKNNENVTICVDIWNIFYFKKL